MEGGRERRREGETTGQMEDDRHDRIEEGGKEL